MLPRQKKTLSIFVAVLSLLFCSPHSSQQFPSGTNVAQPVHVLSDELTSEQISREVLTEVVRLLTSSTMQYYFYLMHWANKSTKKNKRQRRFFNRSELQARAQVIVDTMVFLNAAAIGVWFFIDPHQAADHDRLVLKRKVAKSGFVPADPMMNWRIFSQHAMHKWKKLSLISAREK